MSDPYADVRAAALAFARADRRPQVLATVGDSPLPFCLAKETWDRLYAGKPQYHLLEEVTP